MNIHEPVRPPVDAPPGLSYFRGKICHVNHTKGIGFISHPSIHQISGPPLVLPQRDLMFHINENRGLGQPLPNQRWINFFVRRSYGKSKSGLEVFNAKPEPATTPA